MAQKIMEKNVIGKKKKNPHVWHGILILRTDIILHCSLIHFPNLGNGLSK